MQQDGGAVSLKDVPGFKKAAKLGIKYISNHVGCSVNTTNWKSSASDLKDQLNKLLESTIINSYYAPPPQLYSPNNTNLVRDRVRAPTRRNLFKLQEDDDDLNMDDEDADFNPVDDNSQHGEDGQVDGTGTQEVGSVAKEDGSAAQEEGSASQVNFPLKIRQFKEKVLGSKPEFRQEAITAELPSIHADLRKA